MLQGYELFWNGSAQCLIKHTSFISFILLFPHGPFLILRKLLSYLLLIIVRMLPSPAVTLSHGFVSDVKNLYINTVVPLYNVQLEDLYSSNRTKYWITLLTLVSGRTVSAMFSIAFNALKFDLLQAKSSMLKYEPFRERWHLPESSVFGTGRGRRK